MNLLPTIQDIEHVGVWIFAVLLVAMALGGVFALLHVLIGPWFDVKDARYVAQQRRERARRIVVVKGTRVVPAVAEHEQEIVEWECEDASLLSAGQWREGR